MPRPLHPSTLAAITKLAQKHGLPLVRADDEVVMLGDHVAKRSIFDDRWYYANGDGPLCRSPLEALRHALQEEL